MKDTSLQLTKLKYFITNCTATPGSLANYTDFKRINECVHKCFPQYNELLEIDSPDLANHIFETLMNDTTFQKHDEKGIF